MVREPVGQGRGDGPELPPRGHDQLHFKHRPPRPGPEAWGRAFRARSTVYEEGIVRLWVRRTNRVLGRAPVDGYRRVVLSACGEAAGPGSSWSAVQRARAATHASWARRCQAGLILYWKLNRLPPSGRGRIEGPSWSIRGRPDASQQKWQPCQGTRRAGRSAPTSSTSLRHF